MWCDEMFDIIRELDISNTVRKTMGIAIFSAEDIIKYPMAVP